MQLVQKIRQLHKAIPADVRHMDTPAILNIFKEARDIALSEENQSLGGLVLANKHICQIKDSLIGKCAVCEYELERRYIRKVLESDDVEKALGDYQAYERYVTMLGQEMAALQTAGQKPLRKVLFCGSGPLPMSAFILKREFGLDVTTLDYDVETNDITCQLNNKMRPELRLNHLHQDYFTFTGFADFDAVMVASLIGVCPDQKRRVLKHLHGNMSADQLVLVRSAYGLRSLFYAEIPQDAFTGFNVVRVIEASKNVFNMAMLIRKSS